jgi:hypothetical protein
LAESNFKFGKLALELLLREADYVNAWNLYTLREFKFGKTHVNGAKITIMVTMRKNTRLLVEGAENSKLGSMNS